MKQFAPSKILVLLIFIFKVSVFQAQCAYSGSPLSQAGATVTFCVDNITSVSTSVNAGQYVLVNVVKGFNYTFSVGNVFTSLNENLTLINASTNSNVTPSTFASGASGTSITWTSTLSGQIKVLLSKGSCINDNTTGGAITAVLNSIGNTQDLQTSSGSDQWIGHVYNWTGTAPPGGISPATLSATSPFITSNYVGYYAIATESFSEGFGGNTVCFPVYSNGVVAASIYTEQYAVRYRMRSTKTGCYVATFTGDDGVRVYVDGVKVFDEWKEQSPAGYGNVLLYLNGNSEIVFDYYENAGQNVANFNLTAFNGMSNSVVATNTMACSGVSAGLLNGSAYAYNGATVNPTIAFQWQSSNDNSIFSNIAGATIEDYTPPAISTTTSNTTIYYRRVVTAAASNASGCSYYSNTIAITTSPSGTPATPVSISGTSSPCQNSTSLVYSITPVTNAVTYNWTVPTGWSITAGAGTTSITVTAGSAGQNGTINVTATNGCGTSGTRTLAVTSAANSVGGTASSNQTICSGNQPANITLTGNVGSVVKWQKSSDAAFTTPIDIANTTTTLTGTSIGALTSITYFRAVVQNSTCSIVNSNTVTVTVNSNTTPTFSITSSICSGATAQTLPTTSSNGITGTWSPSAINNTTSGTYTFTPNAGLCAVSVAATVTVVSNVIPTFNAVPAFCYGTTSPVLPTTSTNGISGTWSPANVSNTASSTYTFTPTPTGQCVSNATLNITVTPASNGGTTSANQSVCYNTQPTDVTLTGNVGSVIKWQKSVDVAFSSPIDLANTTTTLTGASIGVLTTTTYFRAVVQNSSCSIVNSNSISITVEQIPLSQSAVGTPVTFCVDSTNTIYSSTVNSGQFISVNVVKGFSYSFSVGNVFTSNENLTLLNGSTNDNLSPSVSASAANGVTITWTATFSGQIKVVLSKGTCVNDNSAGGSITSTLNSVGNTQDSQLSFGTDQWVGHVYNWTGVAPPGGVSPSTPTATGAFATSNYVGYYNVTTEVFSEGFGGDYACFPVYSNGEIKTNVYTQQYAVRYRMRSTKTGCYLVTCAGDDGVRLYIDGVKVFDQWNEQGSTTYGNLLVYLNGNSDIVLDYYENGGANTLSFNLTPFQPSTNTFTAASTMVCSGVSPGLLNGSAYSYNGATANPTISFQWQSSADNSTFANISGATSEDYTPAGISATTSNITTYYRRVVSAAAVNASGCASISNVIAIITSPTGIPVTPASISGLSTQCATSANQVYSCATVPNAVTYNWTIPTGWTITAGLGTNSITVTTGTAGQNGNINVTATNGCGTSGTKTLAVTVSTAAVAGTVSANQTICTGLQPANITLSGSTGAIQWQSSTNNVSFTNITGATTATLSGATMGVLTLTTYYRAVLTVGVCSTVNSASVVANVNSNTAISSQPLTTQTVCLNGTSSNLIVNVTGTSLTYQWYSNNSNATTGGTIISGAASASYTPLTSTSGTKYYYCTISGSCGVSVTSTTSAVIVSPTSVAGTVAANQTICSGTQPANITLTANTGNVQWQSSTDNISFTNVSGATTASLQSAQMGTLTATTYYRAVVTNSVCSSVNTSVITVAVTAIGTVSSSQTICSGLQPSSLIFSGYTGAFLWQTSTDNISFSDISGATTATLTSTTIGALTATKYFRVRMTSGICSAATSNVVTIAVNPVSVAGTVSVNQTICSGTQPATITLSGNNGTIQWQSSTDNISFANISGVTSAGLTSAQMGSLTATKYYRAVVTSGVCSASTSSVITITVNPISVAGIVAENQTICSGTQPATITLSGSTGTIQWQSSTDNVSFTNISGATTATLTSTQMGSLTATKYYRAVVTSGVCSSATSSVVTITVSGVTLTAVNTSSQTICSNSNAILSANSPTIGTGAWSVVSGPSVLTSQFSNVSSSTAEFTPTGGVGNYTIRWTISNGTCGTSTADAVIAVVALPTATISSNNNPVCIGANAIFTVTGTAGAIVTYAINSGANSNVTLTSGTATISVVATAPQTVTLISVSNGSCSQVLNGTSTVTIGTNEWFGGTGDWTVASNWTCGLVPTINTPVVINSGIVTVPADAFSNSLTINSTATVTVNSGIDLTVDTVLNVATAAHLTIKNNANLLQNGTVNNNIGTSVTVNRNSSALFRLDYTLWSSPTSGTQTLANFSPQTSVNRYYTYTTATDFYTGNTGAISFDAAKGYLIRMPNNWISWSATATPVIWSGAFNGKPNNGDISIGVSTVGNRYNAIGNPYPSEINIASFLNYNIDNFNNIEGTLWFWRKTNDYTNPVSYSTCTLVGSAVQNRHSYTDDQKISVGQGFFVKAKVGASTVYFNNAMRSSTNINQFFKTNTIVDRYWLELKNTAGVSFGQKLIAYVPDATLGYDTKYDGLFINDSQTALTSMSGDKEVVIQARPDFDSQDVVHLMFKTNTAGNYLIALNQFEGVFALGQQILLRDNLTGTIHNMITEGDYSFTSEVGTFDARFDIIYQTVLGNNSNSISENNVVIYTNNKTIHINSGVMTLKKVKIFDIRGRVLIEKDTINATEIAIDCSKIANQILVVQITSIEGKIFTKKVPN